MLTLNSHSSQLCRTSTLRCHIHCARLISRAISAHKIFLFLCRLPHWCCFFAFSTHEVSWWLCKHFAMELCGGCALRAPVRIQRLSQVWCQQWIPWTQHRAQVLCPNLSSVFNAAHHNHEFQCFPSPQAVPFSLPGFMSGCGFSSVEEVHYPSRSPGLQPLHGKSTRKISQTYISSYPSEGEKKNGNSDGDYKNEQWLTGRQSLFNYHSKGIFLLVRSASLVEVFHSRHL